MSDTVKVLNDDALRGIEARANAATPGPWRQSALAGMYIVADGRDFATVASVGEYNADGSIHLAFTDAEENLSFMANAREDIPALCATVRALREQLDEWESHREGIIEAVQTAEARVGGLESTNTALREQLAQRDFRIKTLKQDLEQVQKNNARFQSDLAQTEAARDQLSAALSVRDAQLKEMKDQLAQVTQEPLTATIDILEQRRRQLGAESIPEYARTINFLQAIIDEKKKEYPPLRAAGSKGKEDG